MSSTNDNMEIRFLHAIQNDNNMSKLWKFRFFLNKYPKSASNILDKMLNLALQNELFGEYELICKIVGKQLLRQGKYDEIKLKIMPILTELKNEASNYQSLNRLDEQVKKYKQIADLLAQHGQHKESQYYFSKIIQKQVGQIIKQEDYLYQWGKQIFYLIDNPTDYNREGINKKNYQDLEIFAIKIFEDQKKTNATLSFIKDIFKLTRKGRGKGRAKVFQNLKASHLSSQDVINNGLLSLQDLGFLYSLLALAFSDRATLKKQIKWSSKIQIYYLQCQYKKLFEKIQKTYDHYGCFNPTIQFIYRQCFEQIKKRVIIQVLSSYNKISFEKIQKLIGISQYQVKKLIKSPGNQELPFLVDPTTQSIVYYQKSIPLYAQANKFYTKIKDKFDEKQKLLIQKSKDQSQERFLRHMMY